MSHSWPREVQQVITPAGTCPRGRTADLVVALSGAGVSAVSGFRNRLPSRDDVRRRLGAGSGTPPVPTSCCREPGRRRAGRYAGGTSTPSDNRADRVELPERRGSGAHSLPGVSHHDGDEEPRGMRNGSVGAGTVSDKPQIARTAPVTAVANGRGSAGLFSPPAGVLHTSRGMYSGDSARHN